MPFSYLFPSIITIRYWLRSHLRFCHTPSKLKHLPSQLSMFFFLCHLSCYDVSIKLTISFREHEIWCFSFPQSRHFISALTSFHCWALSWCLYIYRKPKYSKQRIWLYNLCISNQLDVCCDADDSNSHKINQNTIACRALKLYSDSITPFCSCADPVISLRVLS